LVLRRGVPNGERTAGTDKNNVAWPISKRMTSAARLAAALFFPQFEILSGDVDHMPTSTGTISRVLME